MLWGDGVGKRNAVRNEIEEILWRDGGWRWDTVEHREKRCCLA